MAIDRLEALLQRYAASLAALEDARSALSEDLAIEALLARDRLQSSLDWLEDSRPGAGQPPLCDDRTQLKALVQLDRRLKGQAGRILQALDLAEWRASLNPPPGRWWWFLEAAPPPGARQAGQSPEGRQGGLPGLLTLAALPPLFLFALALWYRWSRPDPEFLAFSASVAGLLALVSLLGLQTGWGRRVVEEAARSPTVRRWARLPWRLCLFAWLAVLVLGTALFPGSALAADLFNRRGAAALEAGQYSQALGAFRLATSLSERNASAHYNLGSTYEALHDYDRAIFEYQLALELDDGLVAAYNNLGRLLLRAREDPEAALATLLAGYRQSRTPVERAVLLKNIGQAYLEKGSPRTSLETLGEAIRQLEELSAQGENASLYLAETYRWLALSHQALAQGEEAQRAWSASLGYALAVRDSPACAAPDAGPHPGSTRASFDCASALVWIAEAQENLEAGE